MNLKSPVDGSVLTTTAPEAKPLELSYRAMDGRVNRIGHLLTIASEGLNPAQLQTIRLDLPIKVHQRNFSGTVFFVRYFRRLKRPWRRLKD